MLREDTPLEHYPEYDIFVKREDLSCPPPGPPFSKSRGVYARVLSRPEGLIGVLDTRHSQGGWAVARACQVLGKQCRVYYPEFKHEPGCRPYQMNAAALGADLVGLAAGRSSILYHRMCKDINAAGGYSMPNALKLSESVDETAKATEGCPDFDVVVIAISSGTIAAGVIRGFAARPSPPSFILHLGYSRSDDAVRRYIIAASGRADSFLETVDEEYDYKDAARPGPTPPWPCNAFYDLKAFRWLRANRQRFQHQRVLFWNIG